MLKAQQACLAFTAISKKRTLVFPLTKILASALFIGLVACGTLEEPLGQSEPPAEVEPAVREPVPEPRAQFDEAPAAARRLLLLPAGTNVVGELLEVMARSADTLPNLARQFDLGYKEMVAANPTVDPINPVIGTRIVIPTQFILPTAPRIGAVLNISESRLFYYPRPKDGEPAVVITYPIAVGPENLKIPVGTGMVAQKAYNRGSAATASKTSTPAVTEPPGISAKLGGSCIQMYPEDMQDIFDQIPVGTPLRIVNQPHLIGRRDGMVYLKARKDARTPNRAKPDLFSLRETVRREVRGRVSIDWNKALHIAKEARGIPIPILTGSSSLTDLLRAAPMVSERVQSFADAEDFSSTQSTERCPEIKVSYAHSQSGSLMFCTCLEGPASSSDSSASRLNRTVTPTARAAPPIRSPFAVAQEISRALAEAGLTTVQVRVRRDLSVILLGSVTEGAKKTQALHIVRRTPGVKSVKDLLTVVTVY